MFLFIFFFQAVNYGFYVIYYNFIWFKVWENMELFLIDNDLLINIFVIKHISPINPLASGNPCNSCRHSENVNADANY